VNLTRQLHWDLFCRVIDNHGDAGVCWRLAADLAARGQKVRLYIDDTTPLAWMAPGGTAGVEVRAWDAALAAEPGEVVIEAFGCDPPPAFVERMPRRSLPPLWINLEYLSAEDWVERAHGLPSPHASGLRKWFLFPGFTPRTLGLLHEPGLRAERAGFDGRAWLAAQGWAAAAHERVALVFSYDNPALPALQAALAQQPTLLLLPPGPAQQRLLATPAPAGLRRIALPFVSQRDFDRLLWSSQFTAVRGEDSLVRAIWADAPFVWQAYPQHDGAHHAKVEALLARLAAPPAVAALWRAWNGIGDVPLALPAAADWAGPWAAALAGLQAAPDLTTRLLAFVASPPD
jgi:uncharacterized repeat protein (TIGR03837 family)